MSSYIIDDAYSKRINIVRCLSILMIVIIHAHSFSTTTTSPWLENVIYFIREPLTYAAVPLFFLISSILLYRKEFTWLDNMRKKCKSVLLPYLLWNTIWVIIYYIAQSNAFTSSYFSNELNQVANWGWKEWIDGYFFVFNRTNPLLYTLWFMRDLFVLNILSKAIKKIIDIAPIPVLIIVTVYWFSGYNIRLLNRDSIFAFFIGYYFVKYNKDFSLLDKIPLALPIIGVLGFGTLATIYRSIRILDYFAIFCGMILVIEVSRYFIKDNKLSNILGWIASYSAFIYFFHEQFESIMTRLLQHYVIQTTPVILIEFITVPVIITAWCLLIGWLLHRYLSKVYSLLIGFR